MSLDPNKKVNRSLIRKCRSCGKECYGTLCWECHSKGKHTRIGKTIKKRRL